MFTCSNTYFLFWAVVTEWVCRTTQIPTNWKEWEESDIEKGELSVLWRGSIDALSFIKNLKGADGFRANRSTDRGLASVRWIIQLEQQVLVSCRGWGKREKRTKRARGLYLAWRSLNGWMYLSGTWSTVENEASRPWAAMTRHVEG
jgi:hypothetical protein